LVERNELAAAEARLSRGIDLGKGSGRLDAVKNAAFALSRLRQARQDMHGALAAVQEADSALGERPYPLAKAELLAFKTRILVRQGSLNEAAHCAEEAVQLAGGDRGQTGQIVALAVSRVLAARCGPAEAVDHLTSSLAGAERGGRWGVVIELLILRALALAQRGDTREAVADLERALALAAPEGFSRVFLDEGPPMQMLLAQWLAHAGTNPLRDFAGHLLAQFEAETPVMTAAHGKRSPNDDLIEPLSQRELEVLHIMALGKTNEEIAGQLVIARGTVKAHTASIYRKLDVANRTEAVARARQLRILP
jgi:LuxR family maltose regulon positive regulatory protein